MRFATNKAFARVPVFTLTGILVLALGIPQVSASQGKTPRVENGIVDVNVNLPYEDATGAGTGMILSASGEVLTNNHVIRGATTVSVTDIENHKTYSATVVGYDVTADIAVLQLHNPKHLRRVPLGNSASVQVGSDVTAIGNAGGKGGTPSSTTGKVTALHQAITASDEIGGSETLTGLIKTNAALQPGDSGGPLVLASGKVIGMDTAGSTGFSFTSSSGAGYAIPINKAIRIAREIKEGHESNNIHIGETPFLGVEVEQSEYFNGSTIVSGVEVSDVISGSPAQQAGLSSGDIITSVAGTPITSPASLTDLILDHSTGESVQLSWLNSFGASMSANIALASGPPQ